MVGCKLTRHGVTRRGRLWFGPVRLGGLRSGRVRQAWHGRFWHVKAAAWFRKASLVGASARLVYSAGRGRYDWARQVLVGHVVLRQAGLGQSGQGVARIGRSWQARHVQESLVAVWRVMAWQARQVLVRSVAARYVRVRQARRCKSRLRKARSVGAVLAVAWQVWHGAVRQVKFRLVTVWLGVASARQARRVMASQAGARLGLVRQARQHWAGCGESSLGWPGWGKVRLGRQSQHECCYTR